jgi:hypothetical protein
VITKKYYNAFVRGETATASKDNFETEQEAQEWIESQEEILGENIYSKVTTIGVCDCGEELPLQFFTEECPKCGTLYNAFGQELLPQDEWGDEFFNVDYTNEDTKYDAYEGKGVRRNMASMEDTDTQEEETTEEETTGEDTPIDTTNDTTNNGDNIKDFDTKNKITLSNWFSTIDGLYVELLEATIKDAKTALRGGDDDMEAIAFAISRAFEYYQVPCLVGCHFFKKMGEWNYTEATNDFNRDVQNGLANIKDSDAEEEYSRVMGVKNTNKVKANAIEASKKAPKETKPEKIVGGREYTDIMGDLELEDVFEGPVKEFVQRYISENKTDPRKLAILYVCLDTKSKETGKVAKRIAEYTTEKNKLYNYVNKSFGADQKGLKTFLDSIK